MNEHFRNSYSILITLVILTFQCDIYSQNKFFTGIQSNLWNNANNWNPVGVPVETDDVEIGNINTAQLSGISPVIKSLKITSNGVLIINDPNTTLTIQNAPAKGLHLLLSGDLFIEQGTINIINPGTEGLYIEDTQTSLVNSGTIAIQNHGTVAIFTKESIQLTNNGILFINQFVPNSQTFGLQATGGTIMNSNGGELFINYCQSSAMVPLQISPNVEYTNTGQLSILPSQCLP